MVTLDPGATTILSHIDAQSAALADVAVLDIKAKPVGGWLLSRRGKRSAEGGGVPTIVTFVTPEAGNCHNRVVCAAMRFVEQPGAAGHRGAWLGATMDAPAASHPNITHSEKKGKGTRISKLHLFQVDQI